MRPDTPTSLTPLHVPGIDGHVLYRTQVIGDGESLAVTVDVPQGPIRSGLLRWTGQRWRIDSGKIQVFADTTVAAVRAFAQAAAAPQPPPPCFLCGAPGERDPSGIPWCPEHVAP